MRIIPVGSRALKIHTRQSDYDFLKCEKSGNNTHTLELKSYRGKKADVHCYSFQSKGELLAYIESDNSTYSNACLIYPKFRKYWGVTLKEALQHVNRAILRPYEAYYWASQINNKKAKRSVLKRLYKTYKEGLTNGKAND